MLCDRHRRSTEINAPAVVNWKVKKKKQNKSTLKQVQENTYNRVEKEISVVVDDES